MGPLDKEENKKLVDLNKGQLVIMLSFLLFIIWIGVAPSGFFSLIDASVADLVASVNEGLVFVAR